MNKKYWYEVFEETKHQTKTLETCKTLKEARKVKKEIENSKAWRDFDGFDNKLHIDKWTYINDIPEPIKEIC
jgi:hypothetical protein